MFLALSPVSERQIYSQTGSFEQCISFSNMSVFQWNFQDSSNYKCTLESYTEKVAYVPVSLHIWVRVRTSVVWFLVEFARTPIFEIGCVHTRHLQITVISSKKEFLMSLLLYTQQCCEFWVVIAVGVTDGQIHFVQNTRRRSRRFVNKGNFPARMGRKWRVHSGTKISARRSSRDIPV